MKQRALVAFARVLVPSMVALACAACGGGHGAVLPGTDGLGTGAGQVAAEPGRQAIPGEATLAAGLRVVPDGDANVPLPRRAAQAGTDFAGDRFVVFFDAQPPASALAPYLDPGPGGVADTKHTTDNFPLVDHTFFRKVSANLASKYSLNLVSRVFYKDVNFAVYQLPQVKKVGDLDSMMLKVLRENAGLVSEVTYDFYVHVMGGPASPADAPMALLSDQTGPPSRPDAATPSTKRASTVPNDPYYVNKNGDDNANGRGLWGLWRMGAVDDQAWTYTTGSSSVLVAVADTGARYTHEDLVDNCIDPLTDPPYNAPGILTDVVNKDNDPWDGHSHGTFCAGEIGAKGNNGKGLAGVCWDVTILPIKVLSDGGSGTDSQVAEGMLLADRLGANIVSMSLGGEFPDRTTQLAAKQCNADGVLLVVAAANANTSAPFYPGYYPECMAVGATTLVNSSDNEDWSLVGGVLPIDTRYDARTTFSNYGDWVDIAAPGRSTMSVSNASDTLYNFGWQGTSMATPYVAGCAALLWSYIDSPTNDKVRGLLQSSATEMTHLNNAANPKGFYDSSGNGTVRFCNVYPALQLYESGPYTPPTVTWDNPTDGATVTGTEEIRLSVTGGDGAVRKVEFETENRQLGVTTAPDGGFYKTSWDTPFEFNRKMLLRAKVYDDKGNMVVSSISVTPSNTHVTPPWSVNFDGLADDAMPSGWYKLDGNQGSSNTSWGGDTSTGSAAAPSLHSSGSTANYVSYSNDWVYAPIIDLSNFAAPTITYKRRNRRGDGGDFIFFAATTDDRTFDYVSFTNTVLQDWTTTTYDLSSFAGKEVRLFWAIETNSGTNAQGISIDDVQVSGASGTAPTVTIESPANGDTVSGLVQVDLTLSDSVRKVEVEAIPPVIGRQSFTPIPDNDPGPNKTFSFNWDSRHTYHGGVLLTIYAYDDQQGDGQYNDLLATAAVSLSVNNPTRDIDWYESFESITTLGGFNGNNFDGDWYIWSGGDSMWRIASGSAYDGSKYAKMGPSDSGNYGASEFDQLYSPIHDCSAAAHPYLRLWHKLDVETGIGDYGKILLVRSEGLDDIETPLAEYRGDTAPAGQWVEAGFDLSRFKSEPFRMNFLFISDSDANVGTGWFIDHYEILDADPEIDNLSPNRGVTGSTITVNGSNFGAIAGTSTVSFAKDGGGRVDAAVSSWSNTAIQVAVPANAESGLVKVKVLGFESAGTSFSVVLPPPDLTGLEQR